MHFIHASDEFYILAERELPETERYDGYPQLENGVGMLRLLDTEVTEALEALPEDLPVKPEELSIATGRLAYPYLRKQLDKIEAKFPQKKVHLYAIRNDFFGESITVAGLITGQEFKEADVGGAAWRGVAASIACFGVARRYFWMTSPAPMCKTLYKFR